MTAEEFIQAHREEDTTTLALRYGGTEGVDMPFALDQIAGFQTAKRKIPTWAATPGTLFPARLAMEQCSSEQTARYKRAVAERLLKELGTCEGGTAEAGQPSILVDLTGGFGVDFTMLAPLFSRAYYVESDPRLCGVVANNLPLLGVRNAAVLNMDCEEFVKTMPPSTIIYIDPARRDSNGRRTYAMADCTPDITALLPELADKAKAALIKLSPMLDITQTIAEIERGGIAEVAEAHIVATGNECKELLVVVKPRRSAAEKGPLRLFCANDEELFLIDNFRSLKPSKTLTASTALPPLTPASIIGCHLYEPNAAVMKAGCFGELGRRFAVRQLDGNSHLFVSRREAAGFPGRAFRILNTATMNRRDIKAAFSRIRRANVAVRNFPMSAERLRHRLRLDDGGDTYVFGTTLSHTHLLLLCEKESTAAKPYYTHEDICSSD